MYLKTVPGSTRAQGISLGSSDYGISIAATSGTNSKGAWTELMSSTSFDAQGIFVNARPANFVTRYLVDIGIGGAGSEKVLVPDLFIWSNDSTLNTALYVPIRVPAGSRISARNAASATSDFCAVQVVVLGTDGQWDHSPFLRRMTALGVTSASTRGTTLTAGSGGGNKGAWSELTSSLAHQIDWLMLRIGVDNKGAGSGPNYLDIGVGAGGSEKVLVPDLYFQIVAAAGDYPAPEEFSLPVHIPAGLRVAARWECSLASETIDLIGYGIGP